MYLLIPLIAKKTISRHRIVLCFEWKHGSNVLIFNEVKMYNINYRIRICPYKKNSLHLHWCLSEASTTYIEQICQLSSYNKSDQTMLCNLESLLFCTINMDHELCQTWSALMLNKRLIGLQQTRMTCGTSAKSIFILAKGLVNIFGSHYMKKERRKSWPDLFHFCLVTVWYAF